MNCRELRFWSAIWRWFLPSIVLSGAGMVLSDLLDSVPPAQLLADQATRLLPPRVFSLLLDALQYWAKPLLLVALSLSWLIVSAVLAGAIDLTVRRFGDAGRGSLLGWICTAGGLAVAALGLVAIPVLAGVGFFGTRLDSGAVG